MQRVVVAVAVVVGCSKHYEPPPPEAKPEVAAAVVQRPTAVDRGGCELKLAGAFGDAETIRGTERSTESRYWTDDDAAPTSALSVNCLGETIRLSFVPAPNATVPFGPKSYQLDRGKGDLVVLARAHDKQLAAMTGTIDVTAFDHRHVAGTVELAGTAGSAHVTITGTFDFPCRGHAGCVK